MINAVTTYRTARQPVQRPISFSLFPKKRRNFKSINLRLSISLASNYETVYFFSPGIGQRIKYTIIVSGIEPTTPILSSLSKKIRFSKFSLLIEDKRSRKREFGQK